MPAASIVPLPAEDARIAVIGLGYVGLPLAVAFGAVRPVVGFDIDARRVGILCLLWQIGVDIAHAERSLAEQTGDEVATGTSPARQQRILAGIEGIERRIAALRRSVGEAATAASMRASRRERRSLRALSRSLASRRSSGSLGCSAWLARVVSTSISRRR